MMKYKIIPDDVVKNIIEFLDEVQFESSGLLLAADSN
jgi:hypothetical protein